MLPLRRNPEERHLYIHHGEKSALVRMDTKNPRYTDTPQLHVESKVIGYPEAEATKSASIALIP